MSAKPTVLLVEGDALVRELTTQLLTMSQFHVVTAETGLRGLLALRTRREEFDWLVTGLDVPGLVDAEILADEFAAQHPGRPVVCASRRSASEPAWPLQVVVALNELARPPAPVEASEPEPMQVAIGF